MRFVVLPQRESDDPIRVNPRLIAYYKRNCDGTMLKMLTGNNIYTSLSIMEVDVLVDRAL